MHAARTALTTLVTTNQNLTHGLPPACGTICVLIDLHCMPDRPPKAIHESCWARPPRIPPRGSHLGARSCTSAPGSVGDCTNPQFHGVAQLQLSWRRVMAEPSTIASG